MCEKIWERQSDARSDVRIDVKFQDFAKCCEFVTCSSFRLKMGYNSLWASRKIPLILWILFSTWMTVSLLGRNAIKIQYKKKTFEWARRRVGGFGESYSKSSSSLKIQQQQKLQ